MSYGEVPEWSKGADCKSVSSAFEGPNPSLSTKKVLFQDLFLSKFTAFAASAVFMWTKANYFGILEKMAKISENVINEIKKRITISDVVSEYVTLTKKGDRSWGLCPFHQEKTPSFSVVEDKGFFHCFGCNKSGSMFDFIMEMEHLSFFESVEYLAHKVGVQVREETDNEKKKRSFEQNLGELYDKLANTFHYLLLNNPEAQHARDYLDQRKITKEYQEEFLLGYAPANSRWLYDFLKKKNYSDSFLAQSGLFSAANPRWPLFSDRIMFPIRTWQGKCVGFGGRDLTGKSRAKYINTPETEIYRKRDLLFGLYEALPEVKKKKEAIICEGNFDVISMQLSGMQNTVAPLGTALTSDQIRLLARYCESVTLLFDSDDAGQNAARKSIILCQQGGVNSSVINLGTEKDPSDVLQKEGPEALKKSCAILSNGFDYLVQSALKRYDIRQPKAKFLVFKEVEPFLEATASEIEKQGYIRKLAETLNVSEKQIIEDFQSEQSKMTLRKRDNENQETSPRMNSIINDFDISLVLMLVYRRDLFGIFKSSLMIELLKNEDARRIYALLEDADRLGLSSNDLFLQMIEDPVLRETVRNSFCMNIYNDKDAPRLIAESIRMARLRDLEEKRANILSVLKLNAQETNSEKESAVELLSQIQDLDRKIQELKMVQGTDEDI